MNINQQIKALQSLIDLYELSDDTYYLSNLYKEHHRLMATLKNKRTQKTQK